MPRTVDYLGRETRTMFTEGQREAVGMSIRNLYDRALTANAIALTLEEVVQLTVSPEHRETVIKASTICYEVSGNFQFEFVGYRLQYDRRAPLARYLWPAIHDDASDIADRVRGWLEHRIKIGGEFARVQSLVNYLNDHCTNVGQARYLWPSILPLLGAHEHTKPLAEKHAVFKRPRGDLPCREVLRETFERASTAVASALLLPDDIKSPDGSLTLVGFSHQKQSINEGPISFIQW